MVARIRIKDDQVISNVTTGARKNDTWFVSADGDLNIQNLRWDDDGIYLCHFTGFDEKTVQLSITGMFFF